jgi:hypothetical protein
LARRGTRLWPTTNDIPEDFFSTRTKKIALRNSQGVDTPEAKIEITLRSRIHLAIPYSMSSTSHVRLDQLTARVVNDYLHLPGPFVKNIALIFEHSHKPEGRS